jgi:hypothetical protein
MMHPFLTIVTRCCRRPKMLSENIESVKRQTCHDLEQMFIVDLTRKGIQAADRALAENKKHVLGEYVYILDDDCLLINESFVELVKGVVAAEHPDIIMVKSKRPPGPPSRQSIVPTPDVWGGKMRHGSTNCLCYVMKATLWKAHIEQFGAKPWGGDWWTLESALKTKPAIYWLDEIVADARQLGRGRLFEAAGTAWWKTVATKHGIVNYPGEGWKLKLWTA